MTRSKERLDALSALLDSTGGDATRIEAVKKTQNFRRSWVELARCLSKIEKAKRYVAWGFPDLYSYCSKELTLKRATVDKLLISYRTMHRFAPKSLARDGVAQPFPSLESVSYLSRAAKAQGQDLGQDTHKDPGQVGPKLEALSRAVFDDQRPLRELKRDFDAQLFPPKEPESPQKRLSKSVNLVERLKRELESLELLGRGRKKALNRELTALQQELERLLSENPTPAAKTKKARVSESA